MGDNMRKIVLFILYLIRMLLETFCFILSIIANIFEKKCNENIDSIIAISYYAEELPNMICFMVYNDENVFSTKLMKNENTIKISKKDFKEILRVIKENNILKKRRYILNLPYVSFPEYLMWWDAYDSYPGNQILTIYFKEGKEKVIEGYCKEIEKLRSKFEEILPSGLFYGYFISFSDLNHND